LSGVVPTNRLKARTGDNALSAGVRVAAHSASPGYLNGGSHSRSQNASPFHGYSRVPAK
jgi:hypothetical protein